MKRLTGTKKLLLVLALIAASQVGTITARASDDGTDANFVGAKVVEVSDSRIAIIAESGIEHMIAINQKMIKVTSEGRTVPLKDIKEGDIVSVELDAKNPMKTARNITLEGQFGIQLAKNRR